jgi:hypothetical protein
MDAILELDPTAPAPPPSRGERAFDAERGACAICGSGDVALDEAFDRGLWMLAECRRCQHRWTEGPSAPGGSAPWAAPARGLLARRVADRRAAA